MISFSKRLLLCILFSSSIATAQDDGLDKNSFDQPALQEGRSESDLLESEQQQEEQTQEEQQPGQQTDQSNDITVEGVSPIEVDSQNSQITKPQDVESSSPQVPAEFDQAVMPNPETIESSEDRSLNPATDALKQDYFPSFIYDDRGRKDPFAPVIDNVEKVISESIVTQTQDEKTREGLSKYEVAALKVSAILIGKGKPKALVKDPTGTVYVIHENDIIGRNNGVVRKIRSSQIIIVESRDQKDGDRLYTTQILSVAK